MAVPGEAVRGMGGRERGQPAYMRAGYDGEDLVGYKEAIPMWV
jgi:hypothetical protein